MAALSPTEDSLTSQSTHNGDAEGPDYDKLLHRRKGLSGSEFAGIGIQFAVTIVVFSLAGLWLDRRLGSSPWLTILLMFAGAGLGFWSMYRRVVRKQGSSGRAV